MCDHILKTKYVLQQGTILYSGNSGKKIPLSLADIFGYIGQRGTREINGEFVLYASRDYNTARGYALSCITGTGFVHKFQVTKDVILWQQDDFEDADQVAKCVCPDVRGIVVIYDDTLDEYALCSSEDYLDYIATQNCTSQEWYNILDRVASKDVAFHSMPY